MGFRQTTHETCLYHKNIDGSNVYILRQVDDVAIASKNKSIAEQAIKKIGSYMKSPIKHEGLTELFNGIDVLQTRDYIKLHCSTYLQRVLKRHEHWIKDIPYDNDPLPMNNDTAFAKVLETDASTTIEETIELENEFKFKYRSVTGELIFAMVTFRPDISFPIIKLSQHNSCPARSHFEALKRLLIYVRNTTDEGLYYWRREPNGDLPVFQFLNSDQRTMKELNIAVNKNRYNHLEL